MRWDCRGSLGPDIHYLYLLATSEAQKHWLLALLSDDSKWVPRLFLGYLGQDLLFYAPVIAYGLISNLTYKNGVGDDVFHSVNWSRVCNAKKSAKLLPDDRWWVPGTPFRPVPCASFALHTDCFTYMQQSPLKHRQYYLDYKQKPGNQNVALPTDWHLQINF